MSLERRCYNNLIKIKQPSYKHFNKQLWIHSNKKNPKHPQRGLGSKRTASKNCSLNELHQCNILITGTEDTAQHFRACTALIEDLGSVPRDHMTDES